MKPTINWNVVSARILAVAGLFVTGGGALGLLPQSWREPASIIATILVAALSLSPDVRQPHVSPSPNPTDTGTSA